MVASKGGPLASLGRLRRALAELPVTVAHDVARRAQSELDALTQQAWDAGRDVHGNPRKEGADGSALDLRDSGALRGGLEFVAIGSQVRARLNQPYARYVIGRYGVLPSGHMPIDWQLALERLVHAAKAGA